MVDTIIKGTGNSRSIRSVPNIAALAPTYEKLLELLKGDGLPVDIGGLNPTGVEVQGTDLTKANLLTDETAALYGKGGAATPNEILATIFSKFSPLLEDTVVSGTYSGQYPQTHPAPSSTSVVVKSTDWHDIVLPFKPKTVLLLTESGTLTSDSRYSDGGSNLLGGIFAASNPLRQTAKTTTIIGAEITDTGFRVRNITGAYKSGSGSGTTGYRVNCDTQYNVYQWIAFK